jgi:putative nucleotidyltransferase with HDIG domain
MTMMEPATNNRSVHPLARQVQKIVLERIASDRLTIPAPPSVAEKCLAMLRDGDVGMKQIGMTLERDPLLAAQIMRAASSSAYAGRVATTVQQAAARLGSQKLKTLVIELTARSLFQSRDPRISSACASVWMHSRAVAVLARDFAALTGSSEADECYLAGLLHDIGKPIIAGMLLEAERALGRDHNMWLEPKVWLDAVQGTHRHVGIAVAEKWRLAENVCRSIRDSSDYDAVHRKSVANYVCFANAVSKAEKMGVGEVDLEEVNALVVVGRSLLGIDEELMKRVCKDLGARLGQDG